MNPWIQLKKIPSILLVALGLSCFGLSSALQAVSPAPDGGYPNFTTAEGTKALQNLTTGVGNTGVGWFSLNSVTTGSLNTAVGAGALIVNTANENTAIGAAALLLNTTGPNNTAVGSEALSNNTYTTGNTAVGAEALRFNQKDYCTAVGAGALLNSNNSWNTAVGYYALNANTTGDHNSAFGMGALSASTMGAHNIAVGADAGNAQTTMGGSGNIYIGDTGVDGESGVIAIGARPTTGVAPYTQCLIGGQSVFILGILNGSNYSGTVKIDPISGQVGLETSSLRFKKDIDPMGKTSEAIYSLKPVTFHYKTDKTNAQQCGLIAEEVAKVNPALIGVDKEGKAFCVQYDKINAMLLNEFLKEHKIVEEQGATLARQQKQIEALTAGLQKVSAQLEVTKAAPQTALK